MIQNILSRLDKVKAVGGNRYVACCSSHDDRQPSLSLVELNDGRILIHCFAGCAPIDVLNAVGLEMADLFPDRGLGEFRGWEQHKRDFEYKKKLKQSNHIEDEKIILAVAKGMRREGLRLTPQELEREKLAYIEVRDFENNHG